MRPKKLKSTSPAAASKKRKSASPTATSNTEQMLVWHRHYEALTPEKQETIQRETSAARAAGGSRLAVALHLQVVRRILVGDATNPTQKKLWSAYLAANLPGFSISRAQVFKDMSAAAAAQELFPTTFLNAFVTSGYALNVRPTVEQPLGKFTEPSKHRLSHSKGDELGEKECLEVLAAAAEAIKAEAKRKRDEKPKKLTAEQKRKRILADLHNDTIGYFERLAKAIEPGDSYTAMHLRDDLEEFLCRLMTAMEIDALEPRQISLPDGFKPLNLTGSAVDSSKTDDTNEAALAATAA